MHVFHRMVLITANIQLKDIVRLYSTIIDELNSPEGRYK